MNGSNEQTNKRNAARNRSQASTPDRRIDGVEPKLREMKPRVAARNEVKAEGTIGVVRGNDGAEEGGTIGPKEQKTKRVEEQERRGKRPPSVDTHVGTWRKLLQAKVKVRPPNPWINRRIDDSGDKAVVRDEGEDRKASSSLTSRTNTKSERTQSYIPRRLDEP